MNARTQALATPAGAIPRLAIGRASDIKSRREADYEVCNLAVRTTDRAAFLGIIKTREAELAAPVFDGSRFASDAIAAAEIASFALAAKEALETGCPPELVDAHLQTAGARIVALLADREARG